MKSIIEALSETDKKNTLLKSNSDCWDSDLIVLDHVTVVVPLKLLLVCNHIASRVDGDEFSIVTDIKSKTLDTIVLSDEYYIPKQSVTAGSIDYLPDEYHHPVVIHRHPDGFDNFSTTDHRYINQNFELSLLYTHQDEFVNGLYNLKIEDAIIQIPVNVVVEDGLAEIDITNIERLNYFDELISRREEIKTIKNEIPNDLIDPEQVMHEMLELNQRVDMMESYFI